MKTKKFQSIRIRTLKAVGLLFVSLMLAIYLLFATLMERSIHELEQRHVESQVELVQKNITYDLASLSKMALDWGMWDDSYVFVADRNAGYLAANMTVESFANIGIDFVIYLDSNGNCIYSGEKNMATGKVRPLRDGFMAALSASGLEQDPTRRMQGLATMNGRPVLLASAPILPSSGDPPSRGHVIMGSYLDDDAVDALGERLNLAIKIVPLAGFSEGSSSDLAVFRCLLPGDQPQVEGIDDKRMAGYAVLPDSNGEPLLGLCVETDREITSIGRKGIDMLMSALIIASFIVIASILLFIERNVLSRLLSLNRHIGAITAASAFSARLPSQAKEDELGLVTKNINAMLDSLEKAELQVVEMNHQLEQKVEERTRSLSHAKENLESEILQRQKIEEQIQYIADHDNLTNLPNRRRLNEQINHAVALTKRTGKLLAVMFIDLDNFKLINDTMGHSAGDKLLIAVSGKLVETLRESDFIARIGGDEFVILIENIEIAADIDTIAQKILWIFDEPIPINKQECFISASIGVALYPEDGMDAETLIKNADIAMYKAKCNGKNQYVFCTPLLKSSIVQTMKLTNSLYYALERGELEVYYQPQVSCRTKEICGMEALLRWNHPELGLVGPKTFIPIAEQNGLITAIGAWVLRTACRQNKAWQDAGHPKICVAVNLSMRQFLDARLLREVELILEETGLEAQYLELEITESIAMKESKYIVEVLNAFKDKGIRISIDDFGTEYASFTHLKHLPVNKIKIDMGFVHGIGTQQKDEAIIKAIILLAKNMGFSIIAEGVESEEQMEFLLREDCDELQGNYCHRPMPAEDVEKVLP